MPRTVSFVIVVLIFASSARAQTTTSVEKELVDLRVQLNDALLKKDRAFLERTFADEFYCIHSNGVATTKAEEIAAWMASNTLTVVKTLDQRVRVYGAVGILNGRTANEDANGRLSAVSLFTDVFVKRDGRWQFAGCQATRGPG